MESTPDPASVARRSTSPTGESLSKSGSLSSSLFRAPAPSSLATDRLLDPMEPEKSASGGGIVAAAAERAPTKRVIPENRYYYRSVSY